MSVLLSQQLEQVQNDLSRKLNEAERIDIQSTCATTLIHAVHFIELKY